MMIIVSERWSGPSLSHASGGWRARRIFDVTGVTTQEDAVLAVIAFDPSTTYNAQHPKSPWMYVENQEGNVTGFNFWTVTITYSSNPAGRHIDPGNPLLEPVRYHFDWGNTTQGSDRDTFGNVIQNSAGQSFFNEIPTDVLNGFLYAERNEPFYDAKAAVTLANSVNNAPVTFFGVWALEKGQACCRRILPTTPITSAAVYVTVQYVIELRAGYHLDSDGFWDGFKTRIENDGVRGWYLNGSTPMSGPLAELREGVSQLVASPIRLDDRGIPMEPAMWSGGVPTGGYFIKSPSGPAACVARPATRPMPATTVFENAGDAWFVKIFSEGMRLADLNALGL